jgi:DinB superfamily
MAGRSEALAKQFEAKAQEATALFEKLSDADWKKVTAAEKWPVGVTVHHIASSHAGLSGVVKMLGDGKGPSIQMDMIHAGNAKHAQEFADCTKADTIALHKKNAAAAAAIVRGLSDAQLDNKGVVLQGMPPMSASDLAGGLLCGHIDEHLNSIRATVGH